jgi:CHAD domain-containing protein
MQAPETISPEPWLADLTRRADSVAVAQDDRSVHQLRVAAGRLSVWLELGGRTALRDDLRRVRQSVAHLRDLDVLLGRGRAAEEATRLRAARDAESVGAIAALRAARAGAIGVALGYVPWPTTAEAEKSLRRLILRVVTAGEDAVHGERDPAQMHALRRRVRRARYALEWLGRDATHARELQDVLGSWHDVMIEELRLEATAPDAGDSMRNALERERNGLLERALETYATHRMWWRDLVGS